MINEDQLEHLCIDWFKEIGWDYLCGYDIAPDTNNPYRADFKDFILKDACVEALSKINNHLPKSVVEEVVDRLTKPELPTLIQNNKRFHKLINETVSVEVRGDKRTKGDNLFLFDFENIENNHF